MPISGVHFKGVTIRSAYFNIPEKRHNDYVKLNSTIDDNHDQEWPIAFFQVGDPPKIIKLQLDIRTQLGILIIRRHD